MEEPLVIQHRGALAEFTLNRPRALNALNDEMRDAVLGALPGLARDPEVYALIIRSSSDRAFCAGGDVRELTEIARQNPNQADNSIGREYRMNWSLECFTKPTVSLMDGLVVGSGVGLMLYGTHRVAGEGFKFAMPETAIGLFPDVGVCSVLSKMPKHMGRYLGLTGRTIGRPEAYRLGLLTHCISASKFAEITTSLEAADTVDPTLDGLHRAPTEPDEHIEKADLIEDVFGAPDVVSICKRLADYSRGDDEDAEWCRAVLEDLERRSPLSLHITLQHLNNCSTLGLREVLMSDYHLAGRFLRGADLHEGVRAVIIDKDKSPKWQHDHVDQVSVKEIADYFSNEDETVYVLPTRGEMQEIRG